MSSGDGVVLICLLAALALWAWAVLKKRLGRPRGFNLGVEPDEEIPVTDAVALLESSGYEVLTTKRKIALSIELDEEQQLHSRLFVDHFARSGTDLYVVKLAKEKKPLEMTGSGLRDALLVYQLLYEEAVGVLYVDAELAKIRKIRFELES